MKYISSRGGEAGLSFKEVLFSGYAKDGGLYFPETVPQISLETLTSWKQMSYPDIVAKVMQMFISEEEISEQDLGDLIKKAFLKFKVPETPINIARLENGLNIAELFHGPTLAFKVSCDWLTQETSDCLIGPGPGAGRGGAAVRALPVPGPEAHDRHHRHLGRHRQVSWDWRRAGHVTPVLTSDWSAPPSTRCGAWSGWTQWCCSRTAAAPSYRSCR